MAVGWGPVCECGEKSGVAPLVRASHLGCVNPLLDAYRRAHVIFPLPASAERIFIPPPLTVIATVNIVVRLVSIAKHKRNTTNLADSADLVVCVNVNNNNGNRTELASAQRGGSRTGGGVRAEPRGRERMAMLGRSCAFSKQRSEAAEVDGPRRFKYRRAPVADLGNRNRASGTGSPRVEKRLFAADALTSHLRL